MSIQKIGSHTYVDIDYSGANLGCLDTGQGLVLVDTPFLPDEVNQWQETVTRLCNKEIAYVINTHHHWDHVLGNAVYSPHIIAHQATYDEMTKPDGTMCYFFISQRTDIPDDVKEQIYKMPIRLPNTTFEERMWLHLGDVSVELIHMGGHSESSIFVRVMEDRVLFTGDSFISNTHPFGGEANFAQWIDVLKKTLKMDVDFIVPGHGEISDKAEVERMLKFFQIMWDRVQKLRREGVSRDKIIEQVHDHINYYPLSVGEEEIQINDFDWAVGRLFDQMGKT